VLHNHVNKLGVTSLHATMPINFAKNTPEALQSLQNALMGEKLSYDFVSVKENKMGVASGILIGGNLSVLQSISGSISDIDTRDKILFLEDLDEYLYHIDRMMMQLKRSGKLQHLKGLVVGGFTEMKDNAIPFGKTAYEIIEAAVADYHFPVAYNFPAGHITDNRTLVMGAEVKIEVFKHNATLRF
jgi:muramoyltetrapeptide carboxypeptidase